jgi:Leucine-rich repeat (LRR) protein
MCDGLVPIAPNSNYLQANFVSIPKAGNNEVKDLLPFKEQLIWLKLGGTQINDSVLTDIAQLTHLTRLNLENTRITNQGIAHLSALTQLQYLNVFGTDISTEGLLPLSNLAKLQQVFLFKTKMSPKSLKDLTVKMPHTVFDTGGYTVPSWTSDTAIYKKTK